MSIRESFSNSIDLAVTNEYDQVIWCRFQQCLGMFAMLLVKASVKWDFLDIYLTTFSESATSKIQNLRGLSLFPKHLKFELNFKKSAQNREKEFSFWDNCIWIGIVKLSLLRTGYFSLAANVLTSSPKIWHVNKRDVFHLNWFGSDQWIW